MTTEIILLKRMLNRLVYTFLLLTSIFPLNLDAQDSSCFTKKIDQFTNKISYDMQADPIKLDSLTYIMVSGTSGKYGSMDLFINNRSVISVDSKSEVIILFTDGSIQKMPNSGLYNTRGSFLISYPDIKIGGGRKMLEELISKKIKAIRLDGFARNRDIELSKETADLIHEKLNCFFVQWRHERGKNK